MRILSILTLMIVSCSSSKLPCNTWSKDAEDSYVIMMYTSCNEDEVVYCPSVEDLRQQYKTLTLQGCK
jgi:hypothetical protein